MLEVNYSVKDEACEKMVNDLYDQLRLDEVYREYEEVKVAELRQMIDDVDEREGLKKSTFLEFLRKIYKRLK